MRKKILFICKKNDCYGFISYTRRSSGLYNSTRFIAESLVGRDVDARIIEVTDNNDIDRSVQEFKPDIVVIEALWVVPSKFDILKKLHPKVRWYVHLHSHIPFLALEGIAMEWFYGCLAKGVKFIANSKPSYDALRAILPSTVNRDHLVYLPNVYLSNNMKPKSKDKDLEWYINVGCFGAIRPLKNTLLQAMSAIQFARDKGLRLRFHVNASRLETGGAPVMKNLIELFDRNPDCRLVQHKWHEPEDFIDICHHFIDIGMQVSLTETFNVVSADYVTAGIPIVVSKEVSWACPLSKAQDDSIDSIVKRMHIAYNHRSLIKWNQHRLFENSKVAQEMWFKWFLNH